MNKSRANNSKNSDIEEDILETELDRIRNLRADINSALKQLEYEEKNKISYEKKDGCDKDNFKRIFKIYYSYNKLKNKEPIKTAVYTALYILWSSISKAEKDKFLLASKNRRMCQNMGNIPETFQILNLISKWAKLNSLDENKSLPYIIYDLNNPPPKDEEKRSNFTLLPIINRKIQEINKILANFPEDIKLMDLLYDLISLFHKLNDTTSGTNVAMSGLVYGQNYYRNIYSAILLFWNFIESNVPEIHKHPRYLYIIMNMSTLSKTPSQDKMMNKITKTTIRSLKNMIPKTPDNVDRLKNTDLFLKV